MSPEQFGPYLVYEELGVGGMATVHRAEIQGVEGFKKPVALKRMHPYLAASSDTVKAFVREAQLASQLHHGNIAQTYELGKANGTYFISMEYVPGPTLTQVIRQCQLAAGAMPVRITMGILVQLCDALDYAHNRTDDEGRPLGIIHRDVSPSNIVISNTGILKLLDFGIAKVTGRDTDTPVTGMTIKGKFDYIAPEYLGGQLDRRADLFAVGVIAHEMLTGRKLFAGQDDFETTTLVLEMPIHPPSRLNAQVPDELDHIVLTALQRDPDNRWQSANAMHRALMELGHRTQSIATNLEILEWVRWAYTQIRSEDASGELERVIQMLDQPSSVELTLTPDQHRELNEFDPPVETLAGVGSVSARPANPSMLQLSQMRVSMGPFDAVAPNSPTPMSRTPAPMIIDAEPIKKRPSQRQGASPACPACPAARPSDAQSIVLKLRDDESGLLLVLPPPRRSARRIVFWAGLLLVAAGAGVLVSAYLFDIELPLIGRW